MATEWNMPRRTDTCQACTRGFEIGETFQAFLHETDEGYERRDYCQKCIPENPAGAIGSWKARRLAPATKKVLPFDRDAVYAFFELLEDAEASHQVQFRFVLALLLWRKKALKLERTTEQNGRELWDFVTPRTGARHSVERPDLDEAQLEQLSGQLEQLLAGEPGDLDVVVADPESGADDEW